MIDETDSKKMTNVEKQRYEKAKATLKRIASDLESTSRYILKIYVRVLIIVIVFVVFLIVLLAALGSLNEMTIAILMFFAMFFLPTTISTIARRKKDLENSMLYQSDLYLDTKSLAFLENEVIRIQKLNKGKKFISKNGDLIDGGLDE